MDGRLNDRRAEIYTYESENIVYGLSWSVSTHLAFCILLSSDHTRILLACFIHLIHKFFLKLPENNRSGLTSLLGCRTGVTGNFDWQWGASSRSMTTTLKSLHVRHVTSCSWVPWLFFPCLLSEADYPGQAFQGCMKGSCERSSRRDAACTYTTGSASCAVDDASCKFTSDGQLAFQHPYPPTKIMFMPDKEGAQPDLLATTGDYLRIWQLKESGTQLIKLLNNVGLPTSPVFAALWFQSQHILALSVHAHQNAMLQANSCASTLTFMRTGLVMHNTTLQYLYES